MNIIPNPKICEIKSGETDINAKVAVTFDDKFSDESYQIDIDDGGIAIVAKDAKGAFLAKQTLRQIEWQCSAEKSMLPHLHIEDCPEFSHRSFMIDCARHFWSLSDLKKMIEGATLLKFNKFHWHLTDDQGWRIQIDKYPLLAEIGSVRIGDSLGVKRDEIEYGGCYSKDDVREIVEFCRERYIDVIPEFEIPGHLSAMLKAYPEFSCNGDVEIKTKGGVFPDLLCVGNDLAVKAVKEILSEIVELFPYEIIHIGGDESPKKNWRKCPKCQAKMAKLRISDETALQAHFMNHIAEFLAEKGKKVIVWSDAFENGNLSKDVIGQYWTGENIEIINHVNGGGKLIMSDFFHFYLDYPYGMTPLNKVLKTKIVFDEITNPRNVIGIDSPIWTEYISDFEKLSQRGFPRYAAVAECGWNAIESRGIATFVKRFESLQGLFESVGIVVAPKKLWNIKGFGKAKDFLAFWLKAKSIGEMLRFNKDAQEEKQAIKKKKQQISEDK